MKNRYILCVIVALNLGSAFADVYDDAKQSWVDRSAERKQYNRDGTITAFTPEKLQQEARVRNLRQSVISKNFEALKSEVVGREFYKTSVGVSFLYGWLLNQFKEVVTPFYVGKYFSFKAMFDPLLNKIDESARNFLSPKFNEWVEKLEAKEEKQKQEDKFSFLFDGIIPLHYAIEQVRAGKDDPTTKAPFETPQKLFKETLYSPESVNSRTRAVSDLGDSFKIESEKLTIEQFNNVIKGIKNRNKTSLKKARDIISQNGFINFGSVDAQVSNSLDASAQSSNVDTATSPTKPRTLSTASLSSPRKRSSSVLSFLSPPKPADTGTLDLNTPIQTIKDPRAELILVLANIYFEERPYTKQLSGMTGEGKFFRAFSSTKDENIYKNRREALTEAYKAVLAKLNEVSSK